jgi:hypothetical protein
MDDDSAVYSANFEESMTVENWSPLHDSRSKIIWEGHGLLSNIIKDQENTTQITGKITKSTVPAYFCFIEVLIQLHPVCFSFIYIILLISLSLSVCFSHNGNQYVITLFSLPPLFFAYNRYAILHQPNIK